MGYVCQIYRNYNLTKDGPYMGDLGPIDPDSDNDTRKKYK